MLHQLLYEAPAPECATAAAAGVVLDFTCPLTGNLDNTTHPEP